MTARKKHPAGRPAEGNERFFEELSKANNELARLHRELAQKTTELELANKQIKELLEASQASSLEALRKSEEKYRTVADYTYDWELWFDPQGTLLYCSPSCERITGYPCDAFLQNPALLRDIVHPDDLTALLAHVQKDRTNRKDTFKLDFRIVHKNGTVRWISHCCTPVITEDGRYLGRRASNRDITERKHVQERLEQSLQEKELLLREIHHRVKNNLAIVASLLDLQKDYFKSDEVRSAFQEAKHRIASLSLIHTLLYQTENVARINMQFYLQQLGAQLQSSFLLHRENIRVVIEAAGVVLDIDHAIPCGLIATELFTNSFKHAFPEGKPGMIQVWCSIKAETCTMTFSDDGIGLPPDIEPTSAKTFGLQLVSMLVQQLDGTIAIERCRGTRYTIRFKV